MNSNAGFRRIIKAGGYSFKGLKWAFKNEAAFRQELIAVAVLLPLAWWLNVPPIARLLLTFVTASILMTELINSAIEALADRISPEHHPLLGAAKDLGSAAVLIHIVVITFSWLVVVFAF